MHKIKRSLQGFTLIELLIVITIIGILAVALLPSVLGAPARARDAARKADLSNITAALELYNSDKQGYPTKKLCLGDFQNKAGGNVAGDIDLNQYFTGGKAPFDPQKDSAQAVGACAAGQYVYCPMSSPYNYMLGSYMEIAGDGNLALSSVNACPAPATPPTTITVANGTAASFIELK